MLDSMVSKAKNHTEKEGNKKLLYSLLYKQGYYSFIGKH